MDGGWEKSASICTTNSGSSASAARKPALYAGPIPSRGRCSTRCTRGSAAASSPTGGPGHRAARVGAWKIARRHPSPVHGPERDRRRVARGAAGGLADLPVPAIEVVLRPAALARAEEEEDELRILAVAPRARDPPLR